MQFYALPDPGHLANKKCLASVEKVSRRLNFPHGGPNCRTFVQESPLHLRSLDACSGVLVGWNVGLRLKALRRPAKLRMCRCSEQCFGFVSPISSQKCSKPCKQNHQSWIARQTALQDGTRGNIMICPTASSPSTYTICVLLNLSHVSGRETNQKVWSPARMGKLSSSSLYLPHHFGVTRFCIVMKVSFLVWREQVTMCYQYEAWLIWNARRSNQGCDEKGCHVCFRHQRFEFFFFVWAEMGNTLGTWKVSGLYHKKVKFPCPVRNHAVSNRPSPYTLATCTWLCQAACIQKTLGQESERTSHFTIWTTWVIV